ncbi:alpha/beta hydrolase [Microbacterium sp. 179-I 3D4 NHS]|uniref:alpha/beta hydrolase n=1 Tax=Microbacterium sp. 179-I 3D4 NHS TaxID=3142381 RepID=UPI0039A34C2B
MPFVTHTLRALPSTTAMTDLGARAAQVGANLLAAMENVNTQWLLLADAFRFIPENGVGDAMGTPLRSAEDFAEVLASASKVLADAAVNTFEPMKTTRENLLSRIENLNGRHASYTLTLEQELAEFVADPENDPFITARNHPDTRAYANAKVNLALLDQEAEILSLDVEQFNRDISEAEAAVATQLAALTGGDEVKRVDGTFVHSVQSTWGLTPPGAYVGPGSSPDDVSCAEYFEQRSVTATEARIDWFTTADEAAVQEWFAAHLEFFSLVGFIPPPQAKELFERLQSKSTRDSSGDWATGPLATLADVAPAAIGNLNGIAAADRAEFGRRELENLLSRDDLTDDQRSKLELIKRELSRGAEILSLFLDRAGDVRCSLFVGDPDTADQIVTVTHGIATDIGSMPEWASIMNNVKELSDGQLSEREIYPSTAVILFMEWESGDPLTVQGAGLPSSGASREVALVEGLRTVNPDAWQEGWAHSLGTSSVATAQSYSPGLFDHLTLFGSAGLTTEAVEALEGQMSDGTTSVSVTTSKEDFVALLGRIPGLSQHADDPLWIEGVNVFQSNGGVVPDYIAEDGGVVRGLPTEGHNAGASEDMLYRIFRSEGWRYTHLPVVGPALPLWLLPSESVGYMDPRSQSFLQAIADFAERAEERQ